MALFKLFVLALLAFGNSEAAINSNCDTARKCSHYDMVCIDQVCRCRPNYRWNPGRNVCELYDCYSSGDCRRNGFDDRRVCERDFFGVKRCLCADGYRQDSVNFKCLKVCSDRRECGSSEVCVENRCRCAPNYRYNRATHDCQPFVCDQNVDCWVSGDKYRLCIHGKCVCNLDYTENPVNKRCYLSVDSYATLERRPISGTLWKSMLILIPFFILFYAFISFRRRYYPTPSWVESKDIESKDVKPDRY